MGNGIIFGWSLERALHPPLAETPPARAFISSPSLFTYTSFTRFRALHAGPRRRRNVIREKPGNGPANKSGSSRATRRSSGSRRGAKSRTYCSRSMARLKSPRRWIRSLKARLEDHCLASSPSMLFSCPLTLSTRGCRCIRLMNRANLCRYIPRFECSTFTNARIEHPAGLSAARDHTVAIVELR